MAKTQKHLWQFASRFKRNAFGWRSQLAIQRVQGGGVGDQKGSPHRSSSRRQRGDITDTPIAEMVPVRTTMKIEVRAQIGFALSSVRQKNDLCQRNRL